ncbi:MAG: hypothetical protein F4X14_18905 [Caldilineaceae bacterium SB0661_bin_32]|uniref:Uncharacterized protein n=1 Tax=Caldilineaceae bacterium SB0661_bin_32 TaxID=2605255 RepID=A0A6B1DCA6_9CHLR|nr:hypothetical protein [Caldilineaceae bacterium SB0661_bin_32]
MNKNALFTTLLALLLAGCGRLNVGFGPLLRDVTVAPDQISPNADGDVDVTEIRYTLSRSAYVSIFFEDKDGERFYFRQNRRRSPGSYSVLWGGVMDEPEVEQLEGGTNEILSRVLPDGNYRWFVQASDDDANTETLDGTIALENGDTELPQLESFAVMPKVFRPNLDGLRDDWVSISYNLSKEVQNIQVYLLDPNSPSLKVHIAEGPNTIEPEEPGNHTYKYFGGVDLNAEPPPDGEYLVVGEANDLAGNRVRVTRSLTIEMGGRPRADVVQGEIDWVNEVNRVVSVPLGRKLCFTAIVKNEGEVPVRTNGPWPGQEYHFPEDFTHNTFNTIAARPENLGNYWFEQPGVFRFGLNYSTTGYPYPFRWAIGRQEDLEYLEIEGQSAWYLMPGKSGRVSGCILFEGRPPGGNVLWWGGLIHEAYGHPNDFIDRITVNVGTE